MQAFELALGYGADVLEIDVRLSRDNRVVVIHDARVDRTCDGMGEVRNMTLQELQQLDAGYHFTDLNGRPSRGQRTRLISLDELFEQIPHARINIDIKDKAYKAVSAVVMALEKSGRHNDVTVGSFHPQCIAWFRQLAPQVSTAATLMEVAQLYFGRSLCLKTNYQYLQIPVRYFGLPLATRGFVRHARARGLKAVYWTINDPDSMRALANLQVSGLVTDRIDIAATLLNDRARP